MTENTSRRPSFSGKRTSVLGAGVAAARDAPRELADFFGAELPTLLSKSSKPSPPDAGFLLTGAGRGGGGGGGAVRATVGFGAGFRGATFLDFRVRRRRIFLFFGLAATCFLAGTAEAAEAAADVFPSAEAG